MENAFSGRGGNVVQARDVQQVHFHESRAAPDRVRVGHVPRVSVAFQERRALQEAIAARAESGRPAVVCALAGTRGVGKTQLAAAYARRCAAEGWRVIAWLNAENIGGVIMGLAELARELGLTEQADDTEATAVRALRWLEACPEQCLLVYDNAEDPDALLPWLPAMGTVRIVLTTTSRAFANTGDLVDVELFTPDEAVAYLTERVGPGDEAAALAEDLGHLPLALAQAAAVMRERRLAYPAYRALLRDANLAAALPRTTGDPYPRGAAEAITLALDHAGRTVPGASLMLDLLAVLSPDGVEFDLLAPMMGETDAREVAARLAGLSLVTFSTDGTAAGAHRLLRRVASDRMTAERLLDLVHTAREVFEAESDRNEDGEARRSAETRTREDRIHDLEARMAWEARVQAQRVDLLLTLKTHPTTAAAYSAEERRQDAEKIRRYWRAAPVLDDAFRRWEQAASADPGAGA
ncbi:MAG TPA: hypothetical protein VGL93_13385 [Streptosporangiaceae bacterium]|jgi:hypothetical protein